MQQRSTVLAGLYDPEARCSWNGNREYPSLLHKLGYLLELNVFTAMLGA